MDKKLQLLESFGAQGDDGQIYKVMAYEHLVQPAPAVDGQPHWESTGRIEYRLADGTRVDAGADGRMRIAGSGVALRAEQLA